MIRLSRNYFCYLISAIAAVALVSWTGSAMVTKVLLPNLTAIVIGLLAINVQTTAVIAVKLRELLDKHGGSVRDSVSQCRLALIEQAVFVIFSLVVNVLADSTNPLVSPYFVQTATVFTLFASLHIFLDTSVSLLVALFPD